MMKIAILDQQNARVIVAEVPEYLESANASSDSIAEAILEALDLEGSEYMIGNFLPQIDVAVLNSGRGYGDNTRRLDEYGGNFKEEVLAILEANKE